MITKDIFFASYLVDRKLELISFKKNGRIVEFEFDLNEENESHLKVNYIKSEYMKIKQQIEKLKGLAK